jgi:uncharacterized protein YccT (UPF0319 family)
MTKATRIAFALLCAGLCGCATTAVRRGYEGPARAATEVAVLIVPYQLDVLALDDNPGFSAPLISTARETQLELLPGAHALSVRFYSPSEETDRTGPTSLYRAAPVLVRFHAEGGRRYVLKYTYNTGSRSEPALRVWIEDDAGSAPAAPPEPAALQAEQPAAETGPDAAAADAKPAAPAKPSPPPPSITPLDNLKQWWYYASEEERDAFRAWMDR